MAERGRQARQANGNGDAETGARKGEMSNGRACVFVDQDYQDLELWYPVLRLREAGVEVDIVGRVGTGPNYTGRNGYPCTATTDSSIVRDQDYAIVVIPGGWAPDKLRMDDNVLHIVRRAMAGKRIVAAICHAGSVLISAGGLAGRHVTSWPSIRDDLRAAGAVWQDAEVVVDGQLVTSRKPDDLPAFLAAILRLHGER